MSVDAIRWAWGIELNSATKRLVLLALADRAGEEHTCFPSTKRVVKDTCLDRKTILKAITEMIEEGLIFDTGERKGNGVRVLKLVGVLGRENETHPNKTTDPKIGTSTEIGITTYPKNGIATDPNFGTQNLKGNLKENLKEKRVKKSAMESALTEKGADKKLIDEWMVVRRKKKSADTERAVSMFFNQAEKSGLTLNTVLNLCATKEWKGFELSYVAGKDVSDYMIEKKEQILIEQPKPVLRVIRKNFLD